MQLGNSNQEYSPEQLAGKLKDYIINAIFPDNIWKNFGASLSKYVREESSKITNKLVENIVDRYWQRQKDGAEAFGLNALDDPQTERSGKRLLEMLLELEPKVERNTSATGIAIDVGIDLGPVIEETTQESRSKTPFPYIFAQEYGNHLLKPGKHFILDASGGLWDEDEELLLELVDRVGTRIRSSIRSGKK